MVFIMPVSTKPGTKLHQYCNTVVKQILWKNVVILHLFD